MKRFDDSTKKLIKNVAALVTSALVLIAATIAWFSVGSKADVGRVGADFENRNYNISYYRMKDDVISGVLMRATVGDRSEFEFDTTPPTVPEKLAAVNWDATSSFDIDSLEPGSFWSFKISVDSSVSTLPCLVSNTVTTNLAGTQTAVTGADRETVLKNVYVYGIVVQTTTDENTGDPVYTTKGTFCSNLYDMMNSSGKVTQRMTAAQVTGPYDVLLDIGVPGESVTTVSTDANENETTSVDNLRNAHDALRQIGADVTLTQITING